MSSKVLVLIKVTPKHKVFMGKEAIAAEATGSAGGESDFEPPSLPSFDGAAGSNSAPETAAADEEEEDEDADGEAEVEDS